MGYRSGDKAVTFEGKILFKSAKSYLVEMTLVPGKYFVPFSQIVGELGEADEDGNREFEVTEWWWGVKEPISEE